MTRLRSAVLVSIAGALLAACVAAPPLTARELPPITDAQMAPYLKTADATIQGQGFLRQQGGGVVTCAGSEVLLMPDVPYVRALMEGLRQRRRPDFTVDQRLKPGARVGQCDADGRFKLGPLPAGSYMVMTEVKWTVGYARQGGALAKSVTVQPKQTLEVLLTGDDFYAY
jgi:hypothetical protein